MTSSSPVEENSQEAALEGQPKSVGSAGKAKAEGGKEQSPPSDGQAVAATADAETSSSSASSSSSSGSRNFFQLCKSFPSLAEHEGQVPTEAYIEAVNSLAEYISKLGLVFWSVRSDITNNCSIVRHYYLKNRQRNQFIEQLIANNKAETVRKKQWTASVDSKGKSVPPPMSTTLEALLWVHLSMTFFGYILRDLLEEYDAAANSKSAPLPPPPPPTEDLAVFFRRAYEQTLAPHSTWLMNGLFEIILKGTPSRTEFLRVAMGSGPANHLTEAEVFEKMRAYLLLLQANNVEVKAALTANGYSV